MGFPILVRRHLYLYWISPLIYSLIDDKLRISIQWTLIGSYLHMNSSNKSKFCFCCNNYFGLGCDQFWHHSMIIFQVKMKQTYCQIRSPNSLTVNKIVPRFKTKTFSNQYQNSHCGEKNSLMTILISKRSFTTYNQNPYTSRNGIYIELEPLLLFPRGAYHYPATCHHLKITININTYLILLFMNLTTLA